MKTKRLCAILVLLIVITSISTGLGDGTSDPQVEYILNPPTVPTAPALQHEYIKILLLGADYGVPTGGTGKVDIHNCHTDSIIMAVLDRTVNKISLISFPRDTLTYIPGVYGIYKLNAAFNCSDSVTEGLERTKDTVTWLMGGIRPDHCVLITPELVVKIGDAIGGLDIDVLTSFRVGSLRKYEKGMQHLDGQGIADYARLRRSANQNNNDYGRTERQRQVLTALFEKVKGNIDYVYDILDVVVEEFNNLFYSDLSVADILDMLPLAEELSNGSISTYVLDGELTFAMRYWNFSFIDQKKRQETIRSIFGVDVPRLTLISHVYANYLFKYGFETVKAIRVADRVTVWAKENGFGGEELGAVEKARENAIKALSNVDDKRKSDDINKVEKRKSSLKQATTALKNECNYPYKLDYEIVEQDKFYLDQDINEYYQVDWR